MVLLSLVEREFHNYKLCVLTVVRQQELVLSGKIEFPSCGYQPHVLTTILRQDMVHRGGICTSTQLSTVLQTAGLTRARPMRYWHIAIYSHRLFFVCLDKRL